MAKSPYNIRTQSDPDCLHAGLLLYPSLTHVFLSFPSLSPCTQAAAGHNFLAIISCRSCDPADQNRREERMVWRRTHVPVFRFLLPLVSVLISTGDPVLASNKSPSVLTFCTTCTQRLSLISLWLYLHSNSWQTCVTDSIHTHIHRLSINEFVYLSFWLFPRDGHRGLVWGDFKC